MWFKVIAPVAALMMVAACETPQDGSGSVSGAGADGRGASGMYGSQYGDPSVGQLAQGIPDRVFFDYDSSVVRADAQNVLRAQAGWLKTNNSSITIEGHCDERGTREYNLALGERRANAVRSYLINLGVPASRIQTISYGKERPAVVGSNASAWAQNRRGVTVVR